MGKEPTRLRRTFTPQFNKDAVRLVVEEGKSLTEVVAHLGIARSLLQRWRKELSPKPVPDVFPRHGRVTGQAAKMETIIEKRGISIMTIATERGVEPSNQP